MEPEPEPEPEPAPYSEVLDNPRRSRFRIPIISTTNWARPKTDSAYKAALTHVMYWQLAFGVLAIGFMIIVPGIRGKLLRKAATDGVMFGLFEFSTLIVMALLLGKSRFPANYISLLLLKCFSFINDTFNLGILDLSGGTILRMLTWLLPEEMATSYLDMFPGFIPVLVIPVILLLTNIKIDEYESVALVGTTFATTMSTGLLLSSMGTPRWITKSTWNHGHFRFSIAWAYFTALVAFFNTIFIIQRGWNFYTGKMTPNRFYRCIAEILIWLLSVYAVLHYMPAIHPDFNLRTAFALDTAEILAPFVPTFVKESFQAFMPEVVETPDRWTSWKEAIFAFLERIKVNIWDEPEFEDGEVLKYNFTSKGWVQA